MTQADVLATVSQLFLCLFMGASAAACTIPAYFKFGNTKATQFLHACNACILYIMVGFGLPIIGAAEMLARFASWMRALRGTALSPRSHCAHRVCSFVSAAVSMRIYARRDLWPRPVRFVGFRGDFELLRPRVRPACSRRACDELHTHCSRPPSRKGMVSPRRGGARKINSSIVRAFQHRGAFVFSRAGVTRAVPVGEALWQARTNPLRFRCLRGSRNIHATLADIHIRAKTATNYGVCVFLRWAR